MLKIIIFSLGALGAYVLVSFLHVPYVALHLGVATLAGLVVVRG